MSQAQKRELLGQSVAAVITTALIAAPLILPPSGSAPVSSEAPLPAQSYAEMVPSVVVADGTLSSPVVEPRRRAARPRVERSGTMAAAIAPSRGDVRKTLPRKLTGWLTGDGSVTVRPFPTVVAIQ
ncbi:MAG TPA: hypothetical protein VFK57_24805 [Vicinamibacterales bacterium]|nr:hypothetical protein [Vicinamibacterales bacterium]